MGFKQLPANGPTDSYRTSRKSLVTKKYIFLGMAQLIWLTLSSIIQESLFFDTMI